MGVKVYSAGQRPAVPGQGDHQRRRQGRWGRAWCGELSRSSWDRPPSVLA